MYQITAEANVTGIPHTLARSKTLQGIAARLRKDGEWWGAQGWDALTIEEDNLYPLHIEEVRGHLANGDLSWEDAREILPHCL